MVRQTVPDRHYPVSEVKFSQVIVTPYFVPFSFPVSGFGVQINLRVWRAL